MMYLFNSERAKSNLKQSVSHAMSKKRHILQPFRLQNDVYQTTNILVPKLFLRLSFIVLVQDIKANPLFSRITLLVFH